MTLSFIPTESVKKPRAKKKGMDAKYGRQARKPVRSRADVKFDRMIIEQCADKLVLSLAVNGGNMHERSRRKLIERIMLDIVNPAIGARRGSSTETRRGLSRAVLRFVQHKKWFRLKEGADGFWLRITSFGDNRYEELIADAERARSSRRRAG